MRHHLILRVITKLLLGPIALFALYVQFHGDYSPGGGFQAGVIMASALILYGLVFGLSDAKALAPEWFVHRMMAVGVLIYAGTGLWSLAAGYDYLDYTALSPHAPEHGQEYGLLLIEFGVGITVTAVMISIYYAFASRPPRISDEEW